MKSLSLMLFGAAVLSAQPGSFSKPLGHVPSAGALGGGYVSPVISKPLGGVALPTFGPQAPKKPARTSGYFGPVYYIPNAFGSAYPYAETSAYPDMAPASTTYSTQPDGRPVVINQYFVTKGSSIPDQPEPARAAQEPPASPGDPLVEPASYYLIAYKDHAIYSALAYWVEGDTLHYVTTQNTHNQASLSLIDIDQSYKLNSDRSAPFSIPGR
jgi:hypothetical protein